MPRVAILLAAICGLGACVAPPPEASRERPVATKDGAAAASLAAEESQAPDADEEARKELLATAWVKDAYVSPGHMKVGVLRAEKEWRAPMIGSWVCGVLRKHESELKWVRFVDIQEVVYQGKSPRQAEISKHRCRGS